MKMPFKFDIFLVIISIYGSCFCVVSAKITGISNLFACKNRGFADDGENEKPAEYKTKWPKNEQCPINKITDELYKYCPTTHFAYTEEKYQLVHLDPSIIQNSDDDFSLTHQQGDLLDVRGVGHMEKYFIGKFLGKLKDKYTGKIYALKIINKSDAAKVDQNFRLEIYIHRDLEHKNIVQFRSSSEDDKYLYVIMELCSNGDMAHLLFRRRRLTEVESRYYFHQIISGVKYLHNERILHRDLTLQNIIITQDMTVKIADFGCANKVPTILENEKENAKYGMLMGKYAYQGNNGEEVEGKKFKVNYDPAKIESELVRDLIEKMLQVKPEDRSTIKKILDHDWMKQYIPSLLPTSCLTQKPTKDLENLYSNINSPNNQATK